MRHYLKQRFEDCAEWIDYRPDPTYWHVLLIPSLVVAGFALADVPGVTGIVLFSFLGTLFFAAAALVGGALWMVGRACADASSDYLRRALTSPEGDKSRAHAQRAYPF